MHTLRNNVPFAPHPAGPEAAAPRIPGLRYSPGIGVTAMGGRLRANLPYRNFEASGLAVVELATGFEPATL